MKKGRLGAGILFLFFALFFLIPLGSLALTSFTGKTIPVLQRLASWNWASLVKETNESASLEAYEDISTVKRYRRAAANSFWLACVTATLATLLAFPISLGLAQRKLYGRRFFETLILLPMVTPGFLYAFAVILLFGKNGPAARFLGLEFDPFSVYGLIFTQVTAFLPLAVLAQTPSFSLYQSGWTAAGRTLGATGIFSAFQVWLPLNLAGILTGWVLVALRSLGDFVGPMLLTSTRFRLLVLEAWRDLAGSNWWPTAAALSMELLAMAALMLLLEQWFLRRGRNMAQSSGAPQFPALPSSAISKSVRTLVVFFILSFPLVICLAVACQALGGFEISQWSLVHFKEALHEIGPFAANSLELGFSAIAVCLAGSLIAARASGKFLPKLFLALATFAFAVPTTIYAISLMGTFNVPPLVLHFTPPLLIIAVSITRMNYTLRLLSDAQSKAGFALENAASAMGAGPLFRFRWAVLPNLKGAMAAGSVLVFISALQDVAIAILIAPPSFYPLSLEIARNVADGLFYQASAFGVVLMGILLVPSLLILRGLTFSRRAEI